MTQSHGTSRAGNLDDLQSRIGTIIGGTASGLIPMAIFTPIYAFWPITAWSVAGAVFFLLAVGWSVFLATTAAQLLRLSRSLPRETNDFDARVTKGMTIVSSIQGGLSLTAVVVLVLVGRYVWILPVVVLVVAVHFYPIAAIFRRTIDYYLGTAMLVVAVVGLTLASHSDVAWQVTVGITGFGAALVTSGYGLWIYLQARHVFGLYRALSISAD